MMTITECDIPANSLLPRHSVETAYFRDSYRTRQSHARATMADLFFAIFGHHPAWIRALLIIRNTIAKWCGLEVPTASEIMTVQPRADYAIGDKIGPWPIFALTDTELVAGRNNKHLDFRLSLLREDHEGAPSVVVSTICNVHNVAGKIYLFFIVPFHKWGVKRLIADAVAAGRL